MIYLKYINFYITEVIILIYIHMKKPFLTQVLPLRGNYDFLITGVTNLVPLRGIEDPGIAR